MGDGPAFYADFLEFPEPGDLSNYYFFREAFSEAECDAIVALGNSLDDARGTAGGELNESYRSTSVSWIPLDSASQWIYERCGQMANMANRELWNFSIAAMTEPLQFGRYSATDNDHYDWHMDLGKASAKRKISLVVQLSDPHDYAGGDLEVSFGRNPQVVERGRGHVTAFPAYTMHRVTPVTQGNRHSLVVWVSGEPFR